MLSKVSCQEQSLFKDLVFIGNPLEEEATLNNNYTHQVKNRSRSRSRNTSTSIIISSNSSSSSSILQGSNYMERVNCSALSLLGVHSFCLSRYLVLCTHCSKALSHMSQVTVLFLSHGVTNFRVWRMHQDNVYSLATLSLPSEVFW